MFKVVADQLRVSQGWVRCGHCSDVFDASNHLQTASSPPLPSPDVSSESDVVSAVNEPVAPSPAFVADERVSGEPVAEESVPLSVNQDANLAVPLPGKQIRHDQSVTAAQTSEAAETSETAEASAAAFQDVTFLRLARRQVFWKKNSVRALSGVIGLVLLALLGLQWVLQHKDSLAATDPRWLPVLQVICQPLSCVVKPLRRVESLVIDSSSFSKSGPESFRLSFVLKNMANLPLEAPLLELTLTDIQDKAILRRVLTPPEFGYSAGALLPARAEVAGVVSLGVANESNRAAAVSAAAVAGYRVLVFYP